MRGRPEPVKRWRWWHNTRWWQRRRVLEIARWSAGMHEAIAQCEGDMHDWDLHHPFTNHGEPAVLCLWCESVMVTPHGGGTYVIYPWSEVYPHDEVDRIRRESLGS